MAVHLSPCKLTLPVTGDVPVYERMPVLQCVQYIGTLSFAPSHEANTLRQDALEGIFVVPHPFVLTKIHTVNESSSGGKPYMGKPYIGGSIRQNECMPSRHENLQHLSTTPYFHTLPSLPTPG